MSLRWSMAVAVFIASAPAVADITAIYRVSDGRMPDMVVRVNDRGESRLSSGNQMAILAVDGESYIIMSDLNGVFAVRQADMIAAFSGLIPRHANDSADTDGQPETYEIVETGTENVGDREGVVLTVRREGQESDITDHYVVNRDTDLAPIGAALARQFSSSVEAMHGIPGAQDFGAYMSEIFSRGTVIRLGNLFRLESVDTSPVPPSEFTLPPTVLTRAEFIARMGWPDRR